MALVCIFHRLNLTFKASNLLCVTSTVTPDTITMHVALWSIQYALVIHYIHTTTFSFWNSVLNDQSLQNNLCPDEHFSTVLDLIFISIHNQGLFWHSKVFSTFARNQNFIDKIDPTNIGSSWPHPSKQQSFMWGWYVHWIWELSHVGSSSIINLRI